MHKVKVRFGFQLIFQNATFSFTFPGKCGKIKEKGIWHQKPDKTGGFLYEDDYGDPA